MSGKNLEHIKHSFNHSSGFFSQALHTHSDVPLTKCSLTPSLARSAPAHVYTPLVLSVLYSGLASNGNSCYLRSCSAILPSSPSACSPQDFIHRTLEGWLSSHQQPPPPCQTSHIPIHPDVILTSVPGGIPSSSASLGSLSLPICSRLSRSPLGK